MINELCVGNLIQAIPDFQLISTTEDATVEQVIALLRDNKISSLPVRKTSPRADNQIVGVIDIVRAFSKLLTPQIALLYIVE